MTCREERAVAAPRPRRGLGPAPASRPPASSEERLAGWVERYGPEMRRHLTRMLGSEADAEDALQEVWMAAHRAPPDDGPGSNVRAWLYRVATNVALDRLARCRRRREAVDAARPALQADAPPPPDAFLDAADARLRAEVRASLASLPRKQREAVWLRWAVETDYATVARVLGGSVEAARANVYQGLKRLREELAGLGPAGASREAGTRMAEGREPR